MKLRVWIVVCFREYSRVLFSFVFDFRFVLICVEINFCFNCLYVVWEDGVARLGWYFKRFVRSFLNYVITEFSLVVVIVGRENT